MKTELTNFADLVICQYQTKEIISRPHDSCLQTKGDFAQSEH